MKEEPTQEEFEKEIDDQKKKATGEKKQPEVAKASVQAVQNEETHTEVQVIDMTDPDNIQKEIIDPIIAMITDAATLPSFVLYVIYPGNTIAMIPI